MTRESGVRSRISEIDWAVRSLRGAILRTLFASISPISFKEIVLRIGAPPPLCAYHLRLLSERGLVVRTFEHSEGRKDFSFYRISKIGIDLLKFNDSIGSDEVPTARSIMIVEWRNMPRCFIHREI